MEKAKKNGGFSIIEVAIATGIVAMTFAAMMSLFAFNLHMEIMNRNRIISSYLAQEAIEIMKQKRDTNWFSSKDWLKDIPTGNVVLSINNEDNLTKGWTVSTSIAAHAKKIYLYDNNYVQSISAHDSDNGWRDTGFTRTMVVSSVDSDTLQIKVTVGYNGEKNSTTVTSYLYNGWFK